MTKNTNKKKDIKPDNALSEYIVRSREYVENIFKQALISKIISKYRKTAEVLARQAHQGEKIDTIVQGKLESKNVAESGDFIVKNPTGEKYIIKKDTFHIRYELIDKNNKSFKENIYNTYRSIGQVYAFKYIGQNFKFIASWGEFQIVNSGDYLASISNQKFDDIYRIEKLIFSQTYKKIE